MVNTDGAGSKGKVAQRKWELNRLGKMKRILIIRRVDLGALLWEEDDKQSHNDINNRVHRQNCITVQLLSLVILCLLFYTLKNIPLGRGLSTSSDDQKNPWYRKDSESLNSRNRDVTERSVFVEKYSWEQTLNSSLGTKLRSTCLLCLRSLKSIL